MWLEIIIGKIRKVDQIGNASILNINNLTMIFTTVNISICELFNSDTILFLYSYSNNFKFSLGNKSW